MKASMFIYASLPYWSCWLHGWSCRGLHAHLLGGCTVVDNGGAVGVCSRLGCKSSRRGGPEALQFWGCKTSWRGGPEALPARGMHSPTMGFVAFLFEMYLGGLLTNGARPRGVGGPGRCKLGGGTKSPTMGIIDVLLFEESLVAASRTSGAMDLEESFYSFGCKIIIVIIVIFGITVVSSCPSNRSAKE